MEVIAGSMRAAPRSTRHTRRTATATRHAHGTVTTGACTYQPPACITLWLHECTLGTVLTHGIDCPWSVHRRSVSGRAGYDTYIALRTTRRAHGAHGTHAILCRHHPSHHRLPSLLTICCCALCLPSVLREELRPRLPRLFLTAITSPSKSLALQ